MIEDLLIFNNNPRIVKIISGGQTGADEGGLEAGYQLGIKTGGTAPKHYRTENGSNIILKNRYNLIEHESYAYQPRTKSNVIDSHLTIIVGNDNSSGSKLTKKLCNQYNRKYFLVKEYNKDELTEIVSWIHSQITQEIVINVAGNRESTNPGIFDSTVQFIKSIIITVNGE